jgi:hypothetical protein
LNPGVQKKLLGRTLAIPGAFPDPGLARYLRTLQADHHRNSLGNYQAISDDGRFHRHFWPDRQTPQRRKHPLQAMPMWAGMKPALPLSDMGMWLGAGEV